MKLTVFFLLSALWLGMIAGKGHSHMEELNLEANRIFGRFTKHFQTRAQIPDSKPPDLQINFDALSVLYRALNIGDMHAMRFLRENCDENGLLRPSQDPRLCNEYPRLLIRGISRRLSVITSHVLCSDRILQMPAGWTEHAREMLKLLRHFDDNSEYFIHARLLDLSSGGLSGGEEPTLESSSSEGRPQVMVGRVKRLILRKQSLNHGGETIAMAPSGEAPVMHEPSTGTEMQSPATHTEPSTGHEMQSPATHTKPSTEHEMQSLATRTEPSTGHEMQSLATHTEPSTGHEMQSLATHTEQAPATYNPLSAPAFHDSQVDAARNEIVLLL